MEAKGLDRRLEYARIVLALIGLVISVYLALSALLNVQVSCPEGQAVNCNLVLNSIYSKTFGIPNTYFGILFFLLVLVLIYLKQPMPLFLLNAVGVGFVTYYIYSEYRLGAICLYCTGVHIVTLALFAIALVELTRQG